MAQKVPEDIIIPPDIPEDVKKEALKIYKYVKEKGITRGFANSLVINACIYIASKKLGKPVIEIKDANYKKRLFFVISRITQVYPLYTSPEYLYSLVDLFDLPPEVKQEAKELINKNMDLFNGRNPKGVVGAIVYLVAQKHGINLYQKTIAEKLGVTDVTIRHRLKELRERLSR